MGPMNSTKTAVVTGASSGIGAATARRLAAEGFHVICAARRLDRLSALAQEIGGTAVQCDVTSQESVGALVEAVGDGLDVLVNNAGGAFGVDRIEDADMADWERMYAINVIGSARVVQGLLPALERAGGTIMIVTSTAAEYPYVGGAGYCGVKAAERDIAGGLRLELGGRPIRVLEICPGMVKTDEFSLVRLGGDRSAADAVYEGVAEPLLAEDIADAISWAVTRPPHVNVDRIVIRPRAQVSNHKVYKG
ncbi:SDR family NAD(P)-dependent oxidoreductase [uncultured Propionibacterium sp.]|uniref:SDR family NAD(P)-dependent oxidoreductase n=1 Tax=uncultured Propionibacterium sp. TaxID=218066 RepID=UPI0037DC1543